MRDETAGSRIRVRCVCGWEAIDEVEPAVGAAIDHGRRVHNMIATRDAVLASAERLESTALTGENA